MRVLAGRAGFRRSLFGRAGLGGRGQGRRTSFRIWLLSPAGKIAVIVFVLLDGLLVFQLVRSVGSGSTEPGSPSAADERGTPSRDERSEVLRDDNGTQVGISTFTDRELAQLARDSNDRAEGETPNASSPDGSVGDDQGSSSSNPPSSDPASTASEESSSGDVGSGSVSGGEESEGSSGGGADDDPIDGGGGGGAGDPPDEGPGGGGGNDDPVEGGPGGGGG